MDEKQKKELEKKALEGAADEVVERYGSAVKEHLVAFSGQDNELGKEATRSLKSIAESKVNDSFKDQNIKQQAGFSAEVKSVAKDNADKIIRGSEKRTSRTDDVAKQVDSTGRSIGGTNDQLFDLVEMNGDGTIVEGTARQLKFVGGDAKSCAEKLLDKKYDKYRDSDVPIEIPKDFYDKVQAEYADRICKLDERIQKAKVKGDTELVAKLEKQRDIVETTSKNLKQSNVTNEEAIFARKHPKLSTAKDVIKTANKAGLKQAGIGAAMSGSISIIKNFVACVKGEKNPQDAAIEVAKDTGTGAAFSYATAFSGAVVKGTMQNASSEYIRSLSKTSLPAQMVSTTVNVGKVMARFIKGEITGTECIVQLGEDGFGELGAAMYATAFTTVVKGVGSRALTVVAGAAGSTIGYMAAVAVYQELKTSLVEYQLAVKERKRIEAECEEAVAMIREYREQMIAAYEQSFTEYLEAFRNGVDAMDTTMIEEDVNGFLGANAQIQIALGRKPQFCTQEEFDDLMLSDESFKL